jgi:type VI secretion system Hcp family effector
MAVSAGAGEIFLKLDGIPGESLDAAHRDWIEVLSFSEPLSSPAGRQTAAEVGVLRFVKPADKSSPKLAEAVCLGKLSTSARFEFITRGARDMRFYVVDLKEVAVESYTIAGARTAQPVEEVTLSFNHATWTYTEFTTTGKPLADHRAYWDFVRNEGASAVELQGFKISAVVRPGGTLGVRWAPTPGQRYQLLRSSRPEGPYQAIRDIAAVATGEERWEELPAGNQFDFFLLREAE